MLAAYDPELDRKIALKLLKTQGHSSARTRLQREALALAVQAWQAEHGE